MTLVRLRINQAERIRDLSTERYYCGAGDCLIEVDMSEVQFARLITTANIGLGEPCTIHRKTLNPGPLEDVPKPPFDDLTEEFHKETKEVVNGAVERLSALHKQTAALFKEKASIGKADRERILNEMAMVRQEMASNAPFVLEMLQEHIEKQVMHAKTEVDAFLQQRAQQLGLTAISGDSGVLVAGALPEKK